VTYWPAAGANATTTADIERTAQVAASRPHPTLSSWPTGSRVTPADRHDTTRPTMPRRSHTYQHGLLRCFRASRLRGVIADVVAEKRGDARTRTK
jgi:hypothetical protein